jgi:Transposase IS66 family
MSSRPDATTAKPTAPEEETGVEYWQRLAGKLHEKIEKLEQQLKQQSEKIEQLEAELRAHKKLKGKPQLSASILNQPTNSEPKEEKRAGSAKRSKKLTFEVDTEQVIQPTTIPENAKFNGYRHYDVQEIEFRRQNIRFKLAEYLTTEGTTIVGELPVEYRTGHYGPNLVGYILYQHYQCRIPQSLIYEQLQELGIDISVGQVNRMLTEQGESFELEQSDVLQVGLETASYIHTDDTGARHQGKNGYCTVIGNQWFTYFKSTDSKSRRNFLEILQGNQVAYVLNEYSQTYLAHQPLAAKYREKLIYSELVLAQSQGDWGSYLSTQGIRSPKAVQLLTEAALIGGLMSGELSEPLKILSDGAGQFNILWHGLCWVHAERGLRRLQGNTVQQRDNIADALRSGSPTMEAHQAAEIQDLLWSYYRRLQRYQQQPTEAEKAELSLAFDQIFGRCYLHHGTLNIVLNQLFIRKAELLLGLDWIQLPLHNNAAETDIREYVTRRKISGGTRSDAGRRARDTFIGLKKTCRKLGVSFWQFLLSRLRADGQIPPLPDIIRAKSTPTLQVATAT